MTTKLVTLGQGTLLPDALLTLTSGEAWVRATGTLSEIELRPGGGAERRAINGPVELLSLEGIVTPDGGRRLRVLLSRTSDMGQQLLAGELLVAVVLDSLDVCLWEADETRRASSAARPELDALPPTRAMAPSSPGFGAAPSFASAIEASAARPAPPARPSAPNVGSATIPARPARPAAVEQTIFPDAGDRAEHFAFGSCEIIKSDGDRLHLRLDKDGRIKEIAIEMLKVTELPSDGLPGRHFKLERKT